MSSSLDRCLTVRAYRVATRSAVLLATLSLGACAQLGDVGPLAGVASEPKTDVAQESMSELQRATEFWGKEVQKNPTDGKAALSYARNLKAMGRKQEALTVLSSSYVFNAGNPEFLSEYGRLALDLGQVTTAAQLLERADNPAKPDWRILSARGTVLAKQGKYKDSITYFERARVLAPSQPSVLNNLAMAYTMDGQADQAEGLLREAAQMRGASEKVKRNLAMVLDLQGKDREAGHMADPNPVAKEPAAPTPVAASTPAAGLVHKAVAKGSEAVVSAPATQASSAPLDPDAIVAAAMKAEAEKAKPTQPASNASGNKRKPKPDQKSKLADAEEPALKPSTR